MKSWAPAGMGKEGGTCPSLEKLTSIFVTQCRKNTGYFMTYFRAPISSIVSRV